MALALAILLTSGCDRPKTPAQGIPAATQPVAAIPPAASVSRPGKTSLTIAGRAVTFPPARAVIRQIQPRLELLVYAEDPVDSPHGDGNHYSLPFTLDIDNIASLNGADTAQRLSNVELQETPDGIYLEQDRKVLQLHDIKAAFTLQGTTLTVAIKGYFQRFDLDHQTSPPQTVTVQGTIQALLEMPSDLGQDGTPAQPTGQK